MSSKVFVRIVKWNCWIHVYMNCFGGHECILLTTDLIQGLHLDKSDLIKVINFWNTCIMWVKLRDWCYECRQVIFDRHVGDIRVLTSDVNADVKFESLGLPQYDVATSIQFEWQDAIGIRLHQQVSGPCRWTHTSQHGQHTLCSNSHITIWIKYVKIHFPSNRAQCHVR